MASGEECEVKRVVFFRDKTRAQWCVDVLVGMTRRKTQMVPLQEESSEQEMGAGSAHGGRSAFMGKGKSSGRCNGRERER